MSKRDPKRFMVDGVGKLNDLSDIDMSKLQYTSSILEVMKKDGEYDGLVRVVEGLAFAGKSNAFIIGVLKKRYPSYCGSLTVPTFKKWLEYYVELSKAITSSREVNLGMLVSYGMEKAEKSIDNPKDDFILKLMDRIDDGTLSYRNKPKVIDSEVKSTSRQTENTLNRIFAEASRFGGMENIEIDDSDLEEGEDNEYNEDEV